jgi:type VI secretion system protein ImpE
MTTPTVGDLFRDGRLADALDAAGEAVRAAPKSADARVLLAELLLFAGNFERADAVLNAAGAVDPSSAIVVVEFRQLLRAAEARRLVLRDGKVPEFLGEPSVAQQHLLRAQVARRAGDGDGAAEAAAEAETTRLKIGGRAADSEFMDFRDADDLWAGTFEVLTTTGKYFWIPAERVASMEFHAPKRLRDLYWRRCSMVVRDGPDGDVYMPVLYDDRTGTTDDGLRLGRRTEWSETAPVTGTGQRLFLVDEDGIPIQDLKSIDFA